MSTFERYLTVWVFLCIVVGIAAGHVAPDAFQMISAAEIAKVNLPVAVLIWLMIIPMLLKIDFGALGKVTEHARGVGVTLFINWAVKPFSMALLGTFFIAHFGGFMVVHFLFIYELFLTAGLKPSQEPPALQVLGSLFTPLWPALLAGHAGPGQGRPGHARIAKAVPDMVFVGCPKPFNKRLMGTFVTVCPSSEYNSAKTIS